MSETERALLEGSLSGDEERVRASLRNGADIDVRDDDGWTSLMRAVSGGHRTVVNVLLTARPGANTKVADRTGATALHIACSKGHGSIAVALLFYGADASCRDLSQRTPLDVAREAGHSGVVSQLERSSGVRPPRPLDAPVLENSRPRALTLSWEPHADDASGPLSYRVELATVRRRAWRLVGDGLSRKRLTVRGLRPSTAYLARVRPRGKFGWGDWSEPSEVLHTLEVGGGEESSGKTESRSSGGGSNGGGGGGGGFFWGSASSNAPKRNVAEEKKDASASSSASSSRPLFPSAEELRRMGMSAEDFERAALEQAMKESLADQSRPGASRRPRSPLSPPDPMQRPSSARNLRAEARAEVRAASESQSVQAPLPSVARKPHDIPGILKQPTVSTSREVEELKAAVKRFKLAVTEEKLLRSEWERRATVAERRLLLAERKIENNEKEHRRALEASHRLAADPKTILEMDAVRLGTLEEELEAALRRVRKRKEDAVREELERMRNSATDSEAAGNNCVVCLDKPRSILLLPCKHLCLCETCALSVLKAPAPKCPVCRAPITEHLSVFN